MGAPGGAVYLGRTLGWIAHDLRSIVERMGHVPMGGPDAVLGDVPLLIKALSLENTEVRADARRALARIAGEDLGADPAPWREWWDSEGRELRERREAEIAVERLFDTFQGAVMTGQWDRAAGALGFEAREHGSGVDLAGLIRRNRRALRKAWRDAGIEHLEIDGDRAKVEVTWGRHGFESRELAARRVDDEWRFDSPPWGHRVVRQPRPAVHAQKGHQHHVRPHARAGGPGCVIIGLCAVASIVATLAFLARMKKRMPASLLTSLLVPAAAAALAVALAFLVWYGRKQKRHARRQVRHHQRAFPLPPRFNVTLPAVVAWLAVVILSAALHLAGVEPGGVFGLVVTAALAAPFGAAAWLHFRRRDDHYRALAAGELDGWRAVALRAARSPRPGFWATLVMVSLGGFFLVLPVAVLVTSAFGVEAEAVYQGFVALAVALPVPVAAGAWLVPRAGSEAERKLDYVRARHPGGEGAPEPPRAGGESPA